MERVKYAHFTYSQVKNEREKAILNYTVIKVV